MNTTDPTSDPSLFDVRKIPCRTKHPLIFQRWADLPIGSHFILVNDHEPRPLYYQFAAEFPGVFVWETLVRGPEEFHVKITKLAPVAAASVSPLPAPGLPE